MRLCFFVASLFRSLEPPRNQGTKEPRNQDGRGRECHEQEKRKRCPSDNPLLSGDDQVSEAPLASVSIGVHPWLNRLSALNWIHPFQSLKTGEIGIRRLQDQPSLHGQGGQVSISGEVARCPDVADEFCQQREMLFGRVNDSNMRLLQPGADDGQYLRR